MTGTDISLLLLTAALFFALVIERLLEILKCTYDFLEARYEWSGFWDRNALKIRERLLCHIEQASENEKYQQVVKYLEKTYLTEHYPGYEGSQVISANWLRNLSVKGVAKIFGIVLGIAVAWMVQLDVFALVAAWTKSENAVKLGVFQFNLQGKEWFSYTVTGIAMGLGTGPLHAMIAALERARANRQPVQKS